MMEWSISTSSKREKGLIQETGGADGIWRETRGHEEQEEEEKRGEQFWFVIGNLRSYAYFLVPPVVCKANVLQKATTANKSSSVPHSQ